LDIHEFSALAQDKRDGDGGTVGENTMMMRPLAAWIAAQRFSSAFSAAAIAQVAVTAVVAPISLTSPTLPTSLV
jgi:hypothetical protein